MRIAKPMLLITTPLGLVAGIHEAFRLAGSLAFLMIALVLMIGTAFGTLVYTIRKERHQELAVARASSTQVNPS